MPRYKRETGFYFIKFGDDDFGWQPAEWSHCRQQWFLTGYDGPVSTQELAAVGDPVPMPDVMPNVLERMRANNRTKP